MQLQPPLRQPPKISNSNFKLRHPKTQYMKRITCLLAFAFFLFSFSMNAQTVAEQAPKPYIDVTGTAEMEIVPDQIFVSITIREKTVNKEKITVEKQEELMKNKLKELGIDLSNLSLSDADADYIKVRWKEKEVIASKEYTLKLKTAAEVSKVFEEMDKLGIDNLDIARVHHTEMPRFRKEVKINAIKAAKEKADYLLTAIGEAPGKPIYVIEQDFQEYRPTGRSAGAYSNVSQSYETVGGAPLADEISFSKIKLQYKISARFEIK